MVSVKELRDCFSTYQLQRIADQLKYQGFNYINIQFNPHQIQEPIEMIEFLHRSELFGYCCDMALIQQIKQEGKDNYTDKCFSVCRLLKSSLTIYFFNPREIR